ncbi:NrfD/PsrC family molybdoenzyme membrane anchor subunit [Candidatus Solirubrobacter pratensis]|uniref:NrfD/PsrC family molybdoenzyme membrane anchor subunit n=1 Tax=Candidatus Solirubrobacter pratensis TaxID=1298857 RepID=UPI0003FEF8B2|nr:NrfD/PsrC family molybdoenzyme membrane anchor subunit [Candidatus Solirubrobacter pratensis]
MSDERDMTPALGSNASPKFGEKTGEKVALHIGEWRDGEWSYLYGSDTKYAGAERATGETPPLDGVGHGMMKPAVWTWEVPLYFWTGGIAAGSAFVALACDLAGDHRAAELARKVSLAALIPSPPLLVLDLGRPMRFLNMLRIVKTRSPMSMGAWALIVFGNLAAAAVGFDLLGRGKAARATGAANVLVGGYLGSYTGVLLAATAVPVWARSRLFLGPIFVCTATATGAAACRLAICAAGDSKESTRIALNRVQTGAMAAELALSIVNERRLPETIGRPLRESKVLKAAKWTVRAGLGLQATRSPKLAHVASVLHLAAGLLFRYGWVRAGADSAKDDRAVAEMARPSPSGVSPG